MKEGMLEVLIYLFENYIVDELSLDPDQDELAQELVGAGFASAEIDIRLTPSLHQDGGTLPLLENFLTENKLPLKIANPHENPPMELSKDNSWIQKMISANPDSKPVGAPWFSDAAHLNDAGIASVCIGPGSIDQAHTKDEFISISDLDAGVDYFESFIRSLG